MDIQDKVALVQLSISKWQARKTDKRANSAVSKEFKSKEGSTSTHKALIARESLQKVLSAFDDIRTYHYAHTMPYQVKGYAVITNAIIPEYIKEFTVLKSKANEKLEAFLVEYPALKEEARENLVDLFDPLEYPSVDKLRTKFNVSIEFTPVPKGSHLRINVDQEDLADMQAAIESKVKDSMADAINKLWDRAHDALAAVKERLTIGPDGKTKLFKDTLVSNVIEVAELIPKLNFIDDQELNDLAGQMIRDFKDLDPEALRNDNDVRKETSKKAENGLRRVKGHNVNTSSVFSVPEPEPEPEEEKEQIEKAPEPAPEPEPEKTTVNELTNDEPKEAPANSALLAKMAAMGLV